MTKIADRVKETTATVGTGTYDLGGAVAGFQGFVAALGTGAMCYYCVTNGTDWEVGKGTITDAATDTLSRDEILGSSNVNAAVNWGTGTKDVFITAPAKKVALQDKGTFTPGSTWPTNVTWAGRWVRHGEWAHIHYLGSLTGAPDQVALTVDPPAGLTPNEAEMHSSIFYSGHGFVLDDGVAWRGNIYVYYDKNTNKLIPFIQNQANAAAQISALGTDVPHTWASGDSLAFSVWLPITEWAA